MPKILVNSRINSTSFERLAGNLLNQSVKTDADVVFQSLDLTEDCIIRGNLTVKGDQVVIEGQQTQFKDNLLVINQGELASGVTLGIAGVQIDRGSSDSFQIVFNEANDQLECGPSLSRQIVTPRNRSTSTNNGLVIFNSSSNQFDVRTRIDTNISIYSSLIFTNDTVSSTISLDPSEQQLTISSYVRPLGVRFPACSSTTQIVQVSSSPNAVNFIGTNTTQNTFIDVINARNPTSGTSPTTGLRLFGRGSDATAVFERLTFQYNNAQDKYEMKMEKSNELTSQYKDITITTANVTDMVALRSGNVPNVEIATPLHVKSTTDATEYYSSINDASLKVAGGAQVEGNLFVSGSLNINGSVRVPIYFFPGDYLLPLVNTSNVHNSSYTANSYARVISGRVDLFATIYVYPLNALTVTSLDIEVPVTSFVFNAAFQAFGFASCQTETEAAQNVKCSNVVSTNRIQIQFTSINAIDAHVVQINVNFPFT